jgi:allantoin racemase
MRIWHQSMAPLEDLPAYGSALCARIGSCVAEGHSVEAHGLDTRAYAGLPPAEVLKYPYLKHLVHGQVFGQCLAAQAAGFDAIALASYAEPFLTECRSLVAIPVASMPESTLLVGCSMAEQMALITLTRSTARRVRALAHKHGLGSRVSGVYALDPAVNERDLNAAFAEPDVLLKNFARVAAQAIEAGADLIIPADGVLNEVLALHGPRRIGDVSIMDVLSVVLGYAELLVSLKRRCGLDVGRRWSHALAEGELLAKIQGALADPRRSS